MAITNSTYSRLEEELANRSTFSVVLGSLGLFLIIFFSFSGNLLVCLAVWRNRALRTSCNYYIISLALTDITLSILCAPLSLVMSIAGRMILPDCLCQAQAYMVLCLGILSMVTMTQTAIHRYLKVVHPRRCAKTTTVKRIITITWITMLLFPLPYFTSNKAAFYPGELYCFMKVENVPKNVMLPGGLLCASIPLGIMTFCYSKVFATVRKHKKSTKETLKSSSMYQRQRLSQEESRITKVLVAVVVGFVICWTPVCSAWILVFYKFSLPIGVRASSSFFAAMSSCVNPFIYGVLNRDFKNEFKKMFKIFRFKKTNVIRTVDVKHSEGENRGRDGTLKT